MNLLAELKARFARALAPLCADPTNWVGLIRPAQDAKFGDYQANFAMQLAKELKSNPRELAQRVIDQLDVADLCEPPEVAGPGFINLRIKDAFLTGRINAVRGDERLGVRAVTPRSIVIDYSGPNVAKPMHVGHLRSTVIGDALCRILRFQGHTVVSDNHIGDWGTQFGMIIYGYKHFLDAAALQRDMVTELARLYRLVSQLEGFHAARAALPGLQATLYQTKAALAVLDSPNSLEMTLDRMVGNLRDEIGRLQRTDPNLSAQKAELAALEEQLKKAAEARKKQLKRVQDQHSGLADDVAAAEQRISAVTSSPDLLKLAEAHPDLAVRARQETAKLHSGDADNLALWQQFVPACLAAIDRVYQRLGVSFDMTLGESFYNNMLAGVVAEFESKKLAIQSDGATCIFLEGIDAPFIIRKSDGAYTYATTDLATIKYRSDKFKADQILYVVDTRQSDHFRMLFAAARLWGYTDIDFRHVSFGTVLGKDGKPYKTRSGDTVGLESLLDEGVSEARKVIESGEVERPEGDTLPEAERQLVAEAVGLGGIKYADLRHDRESDYEFNYEKMLQKTGDTATYLQYAYARACGIFRKGETTRETIAADLSPILLGHPAERALALQIARFPEALDLAVSDMRPHLLCQYIYETARAYTGFFENCPVLKAETTEVRQSRLMLVELTARVLAQGLSLLGVETRERM